MHRLSTAQKALSNPGIPTRIGKPTPSLFEREAAQTGCLTGNESNTSLRALSLSVLVPVYNEKSVVEESLRRLLELNHFLISRLEVIVVDDRSTDGTWEILQR